MIHKTENEAEALFGQGIYEKREFQICVPYSKTDFEIEKKYGEQGIFYLDAIGFQRLIFTAN